MTKEKFIELVIEEQEPLRRFLLALCKGDAFTADDLAQEALLKAYISFNKFEGRSKFSTWLFRIAYNCWCNFSRKNGWQIFQSVRISRILLLFLIVNSLIRTFILHWKNCQAMRKL